MTRATESVEEFPKAKRPFYRRHLALLEGVETHTCEARRAAGNAPWGCNGNHDRDAIERPRSSGAVVRVIPSYAQQSLTNRSGGGPLTRGTTFRRIGPLTPRRADPAPSAHAQGHERTLVSFSRAAARRLSDRPCLRTPCAWRLTGARRSRTPPPVSHRQCRPGLSTAVYTLSASPHIRRCRQRRTPPVRR